MSFFRKKSGLEIPPVASEPTPSYDDDAARNELLGSSTRRGPPSYRSNASVYNASRDGDPYESAKASPAPSAGGGRLPDRYGRSAVGDPYARGGNADADRAQLFSGYDPKRNQSGNRFDQRDDKGADEPRSYQTQEEEDEDVEGIKQQTRFIKQDSVNSTRNALRIAREAEETARNTLLRLGDQSGMCSPHDGCANLR